MSIMKIHSFAICSLIFSAILSQAFGQLSLPAPYQPNKKKDFVVTVKTELGDMVVLLYDETPMHKANFLQLAEASFFDSTSFHRVIAGFMIQGGDPNSKAGGDASKIGQGGPGYTVPAEFVPTLTHEKGALAAARMGDQGNPTKASSGSQFYIVQNAGSCRHLNGSYTVFGQVIQGLEVIDKIAAMPVSPTTKRNITMTMEVKKMSKKKIAKRYESDLPLRK